MSRLVLALALLAPTIAGSQTPAWVERVQVDIDGDGSPEDVRVLPSGDVTTSLSRVRLSLGSRVKAARVEVRTVAGKHPILVVRGFARRADASKTNGRAFSVIARVEGKTLREIWRGETGLQGSDGEWLRDVELSTSGIVLFESRPSFGRCGKMPMYQRAYDFASNRFRPVSRRVAIAAGTPVLQADTTMPAAIRGIKNGAFYELAGVTSQLGATSAKDVSLPLQLADGETSTAWIEGQTGHGKGESITFSGPSEESEVAGIRIIPGHGHARRIAQFNRVKRALVTVGNQQFDVVFKKDAVGQKNLWQWIALPTPVPARCVTFTITDVYRGSRARGRRGDTAISGLAVVSKLELSADIDRVLAQRVAAGGRGGRLATRALRSRGAKAADTLAALARDRNTSAEGVGRLLDVLADIGEPRHAPVLVAGLADPRSNRVVRRMLERSLVRMGDAALPALAGVVTNPKARPAARLATVRLLSRLSGPEVLATLNKAVGLGDHDVRRNVASALGRRTRAIDLAQRAERATQQHVEADLWRAATFALAHDKRDPSQGDRRDTLAAMRRRLDAVKDYERLYRLLEGLGRHADETMLTDLANYLETSRQSKDNRNSALRRVALLALVDNPASAAADIMVAALSDPDAGTRLAAIEALAERNNRTADGALVARLRDSWPEVRAEAAAALGSRCVRAAPAANLRAAAASDKNTGVRKAALAALAKCGAPGTGDLLISIAGGNKQPMVVREYALRLVGTMSDKTQIADVLALLDTFRRTAFSEPQARRLAAVAATTLGALGDKRATRPLLDATRDEAYPSIQAAAVAALGKLCSAKARTVVTSLVRSADRQVSIAAKRAKSSCGW